MKVSLYIRVSTDKQVEGDSLEEQESELKKFCEYKNYLIHKIHIEAGKSAKDTNRIEYQKLLSDIKEKKINAVVVKKLDRLSRSLLDFEEFMKTAQEFNVEFISLKENFDTTNAIGKAMLRVALVFAQLEREQTAERITDVMHYRASQGLYNGGGIPFGYNLINKEIHLNKQEKKVVELIYNKFIETKSVSVVTKEINNLGFKTRLGNFWDVRKIDKILRRPVYTGKIQWGKKVYSGVHQPIVTEKTFNEVQNIFKSRKYYRAYNKIKGLFQGLLYCEFCQLPMIPNYTKKKNNKLYYYYRCHSTINATNKNQDCPQKYISMSKAHKCILKIILEFAEEAKLQKVKLELEKKNKCFEAKIKQINTEILTIEKQLQSAKNKKEKYLDSLISNNFTGQERQAINEQIEEYVLEEKKLKGFLYAKQFELSEIQSNILSFEDFKKEIIFLKININYLSEKELQEWIINNIQKVIYGDDITVIFKLLSI
ncbi:recombinase family protein [bacterium]|nr:recombinase family protein [bacterium]